MKLAQLLAQYLYTHKRLDLPGIGSFMLDPFVSSDTEPSKQGKPVSPAGISFENNNSITDSPDLVTYISSQTGKIRALAAADLDSHLELAKQFLNIGKPFLFEGIGNLAKIRSGQFTFTSGELVPENMSNLPAKDGAPTEESLMGYKNIFYPQKEKINWQKPAALLLLLAGVGLAIWGGYAMYKKTTAKNNETTAQETITPETSAIPVSTDTVYQQDSIIEKVQTVVPYGNYKFVLEVSPAKRAMDRYDRLKTFEWNVQLETSDSLSYKIFMLLPANPADTSKILDSLTRLNGRKVYIED